eukprot:TRINITY_DN21442_c1_g3_i1.p1 TRINITY_DN21442_c1_g3~~TRINITY_DN21442_c1_g3_i1.p1  ORF type:complete len:1142 (+),score=242.85 TRINITY_DN21442_c1_g3_i1:1236-4661(+)
MRRAVRVHATAAACGPLHAGGGAGSVLRCRRGGTARGFRAHARGAADGLRGAGRARVRCCCGCMPSCAGGRPLPSTACCRGRSAVVAVTVAGCVVAARLTCDAVAAVFQCVRADGVDTDSDDDADVSVAANAVLLRDARESPQTATSPTESLGSEDLPDCGDRLTLLVRRADGEPLGIFVRDGWIAAVEPGGAADRAGLRPGMQLLEVDGQCVSAESPSHLQRLLGAAGELFSVTVAVGCNGGVGVGGDESPQAPSPCFPVVPAAALRASLPASPVSARSAALTPLRATLRAASMLPLPTTPPPAPPPPPPAPGAPQFAVSTLAAAVSTVAAARRAVATRSRVAAALESAAAAALALVADGSTAARANLCYASLAAAALAAVSAASVRRFVFPSEPDVARRPKTAEPRRLVPPAPARRSYCDEDAETRRRELLEMFKELLAADRERRELAALSERVRDLGAVSPVSTTQTRCTSAPYRRVPKLKPQTVVVQPTWGGWREEARKQDLSIAGKETVRNAWGSSSRWGAPSFPPPQPPTEVLQGQLPDSVFSSLKSLSDGLRIGVHADERLARAKLAADARRSRSLSFRKAPAPHTDAAGSPLLPPPKPRRPPPPPPHGARGRLTEFAPASPDCAPHPCRVPSPQSTLKIGASTYGSKPPGLSGVLTPKPARPSSATPALSRGSGDAAPSSAAPRVVPTTDSLVMEDVGARRSTMPTLRQQRPELSRRSSVPIRPSMHGGQQPPLPCVSPTPEVAGASQQELAVSQKDGVRRVVCAWGEAEAADDDLLAPMGTEAEPAPPAPPPPMSPPPLNPPAELPPAAALVGDLTSPMKRSRSRSSSKSSRRDETPTSPVPGPNRRSRRRRRGASGRRKAGSRDPERPPATAPSRTPTASPPPSDNASEEPLTEDGLSPPSLTAGSGRGVGARGQRWQPPGLELESDSFSGCSPGAPVAAGNPDTQHPTHPTLPSSPPPPTLIGPSGAAAAEEDWLCDVRLPAARPPSAAAEQPAARDLGGAGHPRRERAIQFTYPRPLSAEERRALDDREAAEAEAPGTAAMPAPVAGPVEELPQRRASKPRLRRRGRVSSISLGGHAQWAMMPMSPDSCGEDSPDDSTRVIPTAPLIVLAGRAGLAAARSLTSPTSPPN